MKKYLSTLPLVFLFLFHSCESEVKSEEIENISSNDYKLEEVYKGDGVVWGFDFVDENRLLVAHRGGDLYLYNVGDKSKKKLAAPKVYSKGQGGLLDVQHVKLEGKEYVYMTFSDPVKEDVQVTSLARGEWSGDEIKNLKTIFRSNADGDGNIHFGSRLAITDKSIYMTVGERGERELAQDLNKHNGSVLRLTFEGKPFPGNPFIGKDGLDEIYSYGHRNPQGIALHPESGEVYAAEMGPRGGDEVNALEAGANYGWPVITYGAEYWGPSIGKEKKKGMEQPLVYWVPSISPSGMAFYTGDKIPEWKNDLVLACLSGQQLRKLELKNGKVARQARLFADLEERFRHTRAGPDGHLYFSTDSGKIFKVSKK